MTHWVDIVLVRAYGDICRIRLMEDRFGAGGTGEDGADFYPVIFFSLEAWSAEKKKPLVIIIF